MIFNNVEDEVLKEGLVVEKPNQMFEIMVDAFDLNYPIEDNMFDSIEAPNNRVMDATLDRIATRINKRLHDELKVMDSDKFMIHYEVKVSGENGKVAYLPYTLRLEDGQVITALIRNIEPSKKFNQGSRVGVYKWALNKKDVTFLVDPKRDSDSSEIAKALATLANGVHKRFIRENPSDDANELDNIVIDISNVVYRKEEKKIEYDFSEFDTIEGNGMKQSEAIEELYMRIEEDGNIDDYIETITSIMNKITNHSSEYKG